MGWGDVQIELAKKMRTKVADAYASGTISQEQASKVQADADYIQAKGVAKNAESKSERFKKGLTSIGTVIVSTVGGLLSGGPAEAATGFVAGAQAAQSKSPGIIPDNVSVQTPPIVPPSQTPDPAQEFQASNSGHWVLPAIIGVVIFRKQLFKLFR